MIRVSLIALTLAGCAANSGVIKTGPNTYSITTSASNMRGAVSGAKRMAYDAANTECAKRKMEVLTISEDSKRISFPGPGQVDLTFTCVKDAPQQ